MLSRVQLPVLLLLICFSVPLHSQSGSESGQPRYGGEGIQDIMESPKRTMRVPASVLQTLRKDDTVKACLSDNKPTLDHPFASWFTGSVVHLDGPEERDLVVVPSPRVHQPNIMCFHSVEGIGWFWFFRRTGTRYQLVLKAGGNGFSIEANKSNGYRDIKTRGRYGSLRDNDRLPV